MSALKAIENRVRGMLARAIVRLVDDAMHLQELQLDLFADERQDGVERFQDYGFTSRPKPGAEAIVAFVGGLRSHAIALRVDDRRFRLTALQEGEVALYDDLGNVVKLGRERIEVTGISEVTVAAPIVTVESDDVRLGGAGGAKIARIGDDVNLSTGKIISGSDKVTAT